MCWWYTQGVVNCSSKSKSVLKTLSQLLSRDPLAGKQFPTKSRLRHKYSRDFNHTISRKFLALKSHCSVQPWATEIVVVCYLNLFLPTDCTPQRLRPSENKSYLEKLQLKSWASPTLHKLAGLIPKRSRGWEYKRVPDRTGHIWKGYLYLQLINTEVQAQIASWAIAGRWMREDFVLHLPCSWGCIKDYYLQLGPGYISIRTIFFLSRGAAHSGAPSHSLGQKWPNYSSWESQLTCAITKGHERTVCLQGKNSHYFLWNSPTSAALFWVCISLHTAMGWIPCILHSIMQQQIQLQRIWLQTQRTSPMSTAKLVTAGRTAHWRARKLLSCQKIKTHGLDKRSGIILNSNQWWLTKGKGKKKAERLY